MIVLKVGDIINVRVIDENEKSKTKIDTYEVESIPRHKRFIVCSMLKNDKKTAIRRTFTALELKGSLVWGGTEASSF